MGIMCRTAHDRNLSCHKHQESKQYLVPYCTRYSTPYPCLIRNHHNWTLTSNSFIQCQIKLPSISGPIFKFTPSLPQYIDVLYSMSVMTSKTISAYTDTASSFYRYRRNHIGYRMWWFHIRTSGRDDGDIPLGCPQFCVAAVSGKLLPYNIIAF
jgi:hypothetical protein